MNKSINLLPRKGKQHNQDDQFLAVLQRISLTALVIIVFCTLTLFALNYDTTLPQLRQQQNAGLTSLTLLHGKTAKILFIKDRLSQIQLIMNKRNNFDDVISQVSQLTPKDVTIGEFDIVSQSATITFTAKSLASLSEILSTMTDMVNGKQTFRTLSILDLSADTQQFSLTVKAVLL